MLRNAEICIRGERSWSLAFILKSKGSFPFCDLAPTYRGPPVAICNNGGTKLPFDLEYNFQLINKVTISSRGDNNGSKSKLLC